MSMNTTRSPADLTEVSNPSDRFVVVKGIKFQYEMTLDPLEVLRPQTCDPCPDFTAMIIAIWEAIVVLPCAQGSSSVPLYLPTLTSANLQGGDLADRVLWKRISFLPFWGTNSSPGAAFPQFTGTYRDEGHGPVVVKSKVRLDDRHCLFYVRNFVHNVVVGSPVIDPCDTGPVLGVVPIRAHGWFKTFYGTRK